jgi:predicted metal-dependent RNase
MSKIRLVPLGGASEIGGSCAILFAHDLRVLVDAGMRPAAHPSNRYPEFEEAGREGAPHAVLITHAHMDHTGGLPILRRHYPDAPIYATEPTIRVTLTVLRDSVAIMERDFEGDADFTIEEVESLGRSMVPVAFGTPFVVASSEQARISATYVRAGHILGAAMIAVEVEHLETGRFDRILFSGDISAFDQPTILGTDLDRVRSFSPGLFVCEGTYGPEEHPPAETEAARFVADIADVLRRGGRVLVPAFAVGRAQNIALILRDAMQRPERFRQLLGDPDFALPKVPVYVDGMCRAVCDHYNVFRELLNPAALDGVDEHVFFDSHGPLSRVESPAHRRTLVESDEPAIYVASSGMLNGGASVVFARAVAGDPRSAVYLVGYQDEDSAGGALRRHMGKRDEEDVVLNLDGEPVVFRCDIRQYGLSAHSDARDIEALIDVVRPARVALVHSTPRKLSALRTRLQAFADQAGIPLVVETAHRGEALEVDESASSATPAIAIQHMPAPGSWVEDVLVGRATLGGSDFSPVTPWVSLALRRRRQQPFTDEEVARMNSSFDDPSPLGADSVALTHEAIEAGTDVLWTPVRVGAGHMHRPAPLSGGLAALHTTIRDRYNRASRGAGDADWHRRRLGAMNVGVGDLVLVLQGRGRTTRILPAVTRAETRFGYSVISPSASAADVGVNQVLSRVGPWVSPAGTPAFSLEEMEILEAAARALSVFALNPLLDPADGGAVDAALSLAALSGMVGDGRLSPLPFTLAVQILNQWRPHAAVPSLCSFEDLHALIGGPAASSPAQVLLALEDLDAAGVLKVARSGGDLQVTWMLGVREGPGSLRDPALDRLGPTFGRVLRRAFWDGVAEARRLGVVQGAGPAWLSNSNAPTPIPPGRDLGPS